MIVHSPVYNLEAIIVDGNGWSNPIAGVPNVLTILQVRGRITGIGEVGYCIYVVISLLLPVVIRERIEEHVTIDIHKQLQYMHRARCIKVYCTPVSTDF